MEFSIKDYRKRRKIENLKRFNFDEFLWFIIIILINLSLIYLMVTGKIEFYIGKKMITYVYVTIVMISIIAIFQLSNVFTPKGGNELKTKILPIILALILGAISLNERDMFKHAELNKEIKENDSQINIGHTHNNNLMNQDNYNMNIKGDTLIVNEENPMILEDIRINPEKYIGKILEIHGFVCKESYLNKNQFIIGRIIMNCCAADSEIVGIIGQYKDCEKLNENEWVSVRGTISYTTISDDDGVSHRVPIIIVDKLEIEKDH